MAYTSADVASAEVVVKEPETTNGTWEETGEDGSKRNHPCLKVGRYTGRISLGPCKLPTLPFRPMELF